MSLEFIFSISGDTLNSAVNPDTLSEEIRASTITKALDYITTDGDILKITMKSELSEAEIALLQGVVAGHAGLSQDPPVEVVDIAALKTTDGRIITKENKRPLFSNGFCTSRGENPASFSVIGGGVDVARYSHTVGDGNPTFSKEILFNVEGNRTWLMDGHIRYVGAEFDEFTFEIRPRVTTVQTGLSGTNFRISGGYLLVPTAGTGTVSVDVATGFYPCSVVPKTDTGNCPAAYWDLDYDPATNTYSNLRAATNPNSNGESGNGKYNIFTADVCLKRYINKWGLLGDGVEAFYSTDPSEFGTNLRAVFKFTTIGSPDPTVFVDHAWKALVNFTMFREKIA